MKVIHIAEDGDDKNDGLSVESAVHSFVRAYKLTEMGSAVLQMDVATLRRLSAEIEKDRVAGARFGQTLTEPQGVPQPRR
jgi:hypothetical protein